MSEKRVVNSIDVGDVGEAHRLYGLKKDNVKRGKYFSFTKDPICCIVVNSEDKNKFLNNLNEFICQFAFWPSMSTKDIEGGTRILLYSIEEPVCEVNKRWKTTRWDKSRSISICKSHIADTLHNEGGYEVCQVYPE